jgi:hypothetical protein
MPAAAEDTAVEERGCQMQWLRRDRFIRTALAARQVVQPDPIRLEEYQTHAGQRRGQWPSSLEISSAMLEHYDNRD